MKPVANYHKYPRFPNPEKAYENIQIHVKAKEELKFNFGFSAFPLWPFGFQLVIFIGLNVASN